MREMDNVSERLLQGVSRVLAAVIRDGCYEFSRETALKCVVTSGMRTLEEQRYLFEAGKTPTMHSLHLTGHAVDLACLTPDGARAIWDFDTYRMLAGFIVDAADQREVAVGWGGNWKSRDGCHFFLQSAVPPKLLNPPAKDRGPSTD